MRNVCQSFAGAPPPYSFFCYNYICQSFQELRLHTVQLRPQEEPMPRPQQLDMPRLRPDTLSSLIHNRYLKKMSCLKVISITTPPFFVKRFLFACCSLLSDWQEALVEHNQPSAKQVPSIYQSTVNQVACYMLDRCLIQCLISSCQSLDKEQQANRSA